MKNYFSDKNALPIPWVESPFFYSLLKNSNLSEEEKEQCISYHENGYLIIDLELSDKKINNIVKDMYKSLSDTETIYHADYFQYTASKRIFQLWRQSTAVARLCIEQKILQTLEMLYGKKPYPFSTINFFKGSNQPLHSDVIHFHSNPPLWMAGVWVAFEDVDETNGSLKIVPGSHKWNVWEYEDLGFPNPDNIVNGEKILYREYEDFLVQLVKQKELPTYTAKLKKGQALIWAANLLHGGSNVPNITDLNKTRLTQANHYFFEGCKEYYHPMYTRRTEGKYASKWCSETNNIATYLKTGSVTMFDKIIQKGDE